MRWPTMTCVIALALLPDGLPAREPPAPHCADARTIEESWQSDDRTLVLRVANGARYRIDLADACPGATAEGELRLLTPGGWLCGSNEERVRSGDAVCAVAGLAPIDAREFARHARTAVATTGHHLDRVVVTAPKGRRFAGSTSYCLNASHMRGWHEDGDGLVVEVSPRRSGGHSRYRVELAGSCPELAWATAMRLESSLGMGVVCGNPGDRAVAVAESNDAFAGDRYRRVVAMPPPVRSRGCPVTGVYPIERD